MHGDLLLQWLSWRGHGSISDVTSSVAALVEGSAQTKINIARAYLRRLEVLGHLDLSWSDSKWRIQPTVITQLPGSSALALVFGHRTPELEERLETEAVPRAIEPVGSASALLSDPRTLLLEYDSESELSDVAANVGAIFIPCVASTLAENLPLLSPGPKSGGPNKQGSPIGLFSVSTQEFVIVDGFRRDGLFRQKINGRSEYWLFRSRNWFSTSYSEGICLALSEKHTKYLQLRVVERTDDPIGTLSVDAVLPLPVQHRRALVSCSGTNPVIAPGGAWAYENVPVSVASAIARSVHQHLQVR